MAQYDGAIRIVTKITTKDAEESLDSLEYQIKKSAKYMDSLRQKMDSLRGQKIATREYKDLQEELSKAEKELQKLVTQQEEWEKIGITSGGAWDTLGEQIEKADYKIDDIKAKMQSLTDSGKDFTLGEETFEYKGYERQLKYEEEAIAKAGEHYKRLASDEKNLSEIKKNSTVVDQRMIDLLEQRNQLAERLKELEKAGVAEGYEEHNKAYIAWKNAADAVKAYRAELDKQTESGQAKIAEKEAKEAEKKEAAQRRAEEQAEKALQKENARIQKQAENEVKLAAKEAERQAKIQAEEAEEQRLAQIRESAVVGNQRIVEVMERRKQLIQEISDMEKAGVGAGYQQYDSAVRELAVADQEIKDYNNDIKQVKESYSKLGAAAKKAFSVVQSAINKAGSGLKKFGGFVKSAFSSLTKSAQKSNSTLGTLGSRFKSLALSLLIFNQISKAFNAMISGMKQGFGNLYNEVSSFKSAVDGLKASSLTLKNSLAAAFRPLVEIAIPYIQRAIDALASLMNIIGQFTAAITGQKTYTKAIKQTTAALEDAKEAEEGYLSPLDEINKFQKKESQSDSGGATGTMFEENVPIKSLFLDMYENIKSLIENQDWEGLGAYIAGALNRGLQKIYDVINWDNVGPQITYFVTAFTGAFNGLVDNLDWDLLGRTIGAGINTIVNTLYLLITGIDWVNLGSKLAEGLNGLATEVDAEKIGNLIGEKFMILPRILLGFVSNLDWASIGNQIGSALNGVVSSIDLSQIGEMLGKGLTGLFQMAISFAATFDWEALGTNIYQGINSFFSNTDWATVGQGLSDFVMGILDTILVVVQGIDWAEVGRSIVDFILGIDWIGLAGKLLEIGVYLIAGLLEGIIAAMARIGEWIKENVFDPIVGWFKDLFGIHSPSTVMAELGGYLVMGLIEGIKNLVGKVEEIWKSMKQFAEDTWNSVKDWMSETWSTIKQTASQKWTEIKQNLSEKWSQMKSDAKEKFDKIRSGIADAWAKTKENTASAWSTIKEKAISASDYVKNGVMNAWNALKNGTANVWESIMNAIKRPINGILGFVESLANGVVNAINTVIRALNGLSFDIPSWVPLIGGNHFGFNIPELSRVSIPRLATGTVVPPNNEFLAVLGDNKREPEVVSPISTMKQAVLEAIAEAGGISGGNNQPIILKVILDGKDILYAMVKEGKVVQMSTGKNIFALE